MYTRAVHTNMCLFDQSQRTAVLFQLWIEVNAAHDRTSQDMDLQNHHLYKMSHLYTYEMLKLLKAHLS